MGQFLRDQQLKNLSIDEGILSRINDVFVARVAALNIGVNEGNAARAVLFYVIRFDEKGFRFVDFDQVKKFFRDARNVERVIFTVDSAANRNSAGLVGVNCELRFDAKDQDKCWLTVTSDHHDWTEATFSNIAEILFGCKTFSRFVRTAWTGLAIQLAGLVVGFGLALWAALKISPSLNLDNAFVVAFFFAFLLFSNVWGYITQQVARFVDLVFPNIRFDRPGKNWRHVTIQTFVFGLAVTFAGFLLNEFFEFVGAVLATLMK